MGELRPGSVVADKYRLERPLSKGGMGSVWVADHLHLEAPVAVKFMRAALVTDPMARARFEREAKAAAQLRSPFVVHVYDHGLHEGSPFIVMEYLEGSDLRGHLRGGRRLAPREAVRICEEICKGLQRAHDAGIVHRDLKPGNIFLSAPDDGMVKLLDFGIAKETGAARVVVGETTSTGQLLGSPHYMSPEQARGQAVDGRSDLWSLSVILFRILTGKRPFDGDDIGDLIVRICTEAPPDASSFRAELGADVDAFFARAFQRDVALRFDDARAFAAAFRAAVEAQPGLLASSPDEADGGEEAVRRSGVTPAPSTPHPGTLTSSSEKMAAALRPAAPETVDTLAAAMSPARSRVAWVGGGLALVALGVVVALGIGWVGAMGTGDANRELPASAGDGPPTPAAAATPVTATEGPATREAAAAAPSATVAATAALAPSAGAAGAAASTMPQRPAAVPHARPVPTSPRAPGPRAAP
ncbi:MAG: serine/threonine-protein kinase, partial [Myxococcota bacterium]